MARKRQRTRDQMLIATCNYVVNSESGDVDIDRRFSLAVDSLRFDLIAAIAGATQW
jgi:hypothetical protein